MKGVFQWRSEKPERQKLHFLNEFDPPSWNIEVQGIPHKVSHFKYQGSMRQRQKQGSKRHFGILQNGTDLDPMTASLVDGVCWCIPRTFRFQKVSWLVSHPSPEVLKLYSDITRIAQKSPTPTSQHPQSPSNSFHSIEAAHEETIQRLKAVGSRIFVPKAFLLHQSNLERAKTNKLVNEEESAFLSFGCQ